MKRRDFLNLSGAGFVYAGLAGTGILGCTNEKSIRWRKEAKSNLFYQVESDGKPMSLSQNIGLLNVKCSFSGDDPVQEGIELSPSQNISHLGPIKMELHHLVKNTGLQFSEDLLEGILTLKNESSDTIYLDVSFSTSAQPSIETAKQKIYIPISATALNRDKRLGELGTKNFHQECELHVGNEDFACHYLEPMGSNPKTRKTKALLLAPVVDIQNESSPWRIALFTPSEEPYEFLTCRDKNQNTGWKAFRSIEILPGEEKTMKCWLFIHKGEADVAWNVFHRIAHHNEFEPPAWLHGVKVHYYDFLSSANGENGRRGDGYEADIPFFNEFNIGLATQHGYYPYIGDFISPERKNWLAMQGDKNGAAEMSLSKMKDRVIATRKTGAKAGVYMHTVLFDEASPLYEDFKDSILLDEFGQKKKFSWKGPDTVKQNWWMSFASEQWTNHLLKQAEYIMELLDPDAIVFDETFVCLGYEHHPERQGILSKHSIKFFKELRKLVHSYGEDKAVLTSDCGGSNMVMWADGDAGDHSYERLLGNPLYRKEPIRYKAAIGDKPWVPCSWHFLKMWEEQMDLARKLGTAVGVSNGWIEFNGLKGLDDENKERILNDIRNL